MLTRRRRKDLAALHRKKGRDAQQAFLVEGVRLVEAAVEARASLVDVVVSEQALGSERVQALVGRVQVPVYTLPEREFAVFSDVQTSQGVLAAARIEPAEPARLTAARTVLVLDGVQDPGNVGTLLRTAAWFGIEAVVAGSGTADFYNPKVVRATMGGLWDVALGQVSDLPAWLAGLKAAGRTCYGADLDGVPARTWTPAFPSVLVLGSEAHGLSAAVRGQVDVCVRIDAQGNGPMARRGVESLNVAIAGAILMHRWSGTPAEHPG